MISLQSFQTFYSRLSKREKLVLYAALIALSVVLLDKAIIFPSFSKMKAKDREIQDKKKIIRKDFHILALKEDIERETKKYEGYFSKASSSEEEVTSTLKEIENLASKAKVSVTSIRPGEVMSEKFFDIYLVNVNCEGSMSQIIAFFHSIETSGALLTIERYIISPKSEGSGLAQCRITVSKAVTP